MGMIQQLRHKLHQRVKTPGYKMPKQNLPGSGHK